MKPAKTISRDQAALHFGEDFVRIMMRGKAELVMTPSQLILAEKWKLIKDQKFTPFAYEYVYLIENGRGHFKVGLTRIPRSRLSSLGTGSVDKLKLVGIFVVSGQEGRNVERGIHAELKRKGIHEKGEWFNGDAMDWWPHIAEFAKSRYRNFITSLSQAWDGCEPMVGLYLKMTEKTTFGKDVLDYRREFLWVIDQAEKGLTVAA